MHDDCMLFSEFMYSVTNTVGGSRKRSADETTRVLVDQSPPAANTRGATPPRKEKGKARAVDKGKAKVVDKGKGKLVKPERPGFIPLSTSRPLR